MHRRSVSTSILFAVLLPVILFLVGSAQSAGRNLGGLADTLALPSANLLAEFVDSTPAGWPQARVEATLRSSPVMFIENVGQFDERTRFQVRGGLGTMWLTEDAIWITAVERSHVGPLERFDLERPGVQRTNVERRDEPLRGVNLKLSFPGANPNLRIEPFDRLDTVVSYFIGNDPDQWHPNVPVWGGVRYVDLYSGVDLELTDESGRWTWRLVFRDTQYPTSSIRLHVEGAEAVAMSPHTAAGNRPSAAILATVVGNLALPLLQTVITGNTPLDLVATQPTFTGNEIRAPFAPPNSQSLILNIQQDNSDDLPYSTFLGGSGSWDEGYAITVDEIGDAYVVGETNSFDFPITAGAFDASYDGSTKDAFVAKLNGSGTALIYATFLGGSDTDLGYAIAVDATRDAYVMGYTASADFPTTTVGFDRTYNGSGDSFVVKLNSSGTALAYSTFIGGSGSECNNFYGKCAIIVNETGNAYVTGFTSSSDFPTTAGTFNAGYSGGTLDVFIVKLNASGTALAYATFLGGSDEDIGRAIAIDVTGNVYVTGSTESPDFPTTPGAFDRSCNGCDDVWSDAFVAKLNASGTELVYSTFLGGNSFDDGTAIVEDSTGSAYVAGQTWSSDFPTTTGAFDTSFNGGSGDIFIVKLNPNGMALTYSTFLGGSGDFEYGNSISVDEAGSVYVAGETTSADFPTTPGAFDTQHNGFYDGFVAKLDITGSQLAYSTFLGGSGREFSVSVAIDTSGNAYLTGRTTSSDFPTTTGAFDTSHNGEEDAFVAKIASEGQDVYEPDNLCPHAKSMNSNTLQTRTISPAGDDDWVNFTLASTSNVTIQTDGPTGDTVLWLYQSDCATEVASDDDGGNGFFSRIQMNNLPAGTYYILVRAYGDNSIIDPYYLELIVRDLYEPDDTCVQAQSITPGTPQTRSISPAADGDWVTFTLSSTSDVTIETDGPTGDTVLWLYQSDCSTEVAYDDDGGNELFSRIQVNNLPAGTYYILVRDFGDDNIIDPYYLNLNAATPVCNPGLDGIILYEHTYYMGRCYTFTVGDPSLGDFSSISFNDIASSIRFTGIYSGQYQVTLYEYADFVGRSYAFTEDHPDFNLLDFNDLASSMVIRSINPVPTITNLNPDSATAGGPAFILTISGTNFVNSSVVRWNGSDRTTTFVSTTQLQAAITVADIATANTASVTVFNPAPGGGTSNALTLTINNPVPAIAGLSPASATAGGAAFTLTVNGTDFVNDSGVRWNGSDRATTFVNSTQLQAQITAADIATAGPASVTVFNPAPGGGISNALTFTISEPDTPDIRVTPTTVEVNLPEGQSTTVPLTVRNVGNATLTWSIARRAGATTVQNQEPAISPSQAVGRDGISPYNKVNPELLAALDASPDGQTTFFVYLQEQADLSSAYAIRDWKERGQFVYRTLRDTSQRSQKDLLADLQARKLPGEVIDYHPFFILNAIAVTGNRSAVDTLAARSDVAYLAPEPVYEIPEPIDEQPASATPAGIEWNIAQIGADRVWSNFGLTGQGVVVASIDTGVDYTHPALVNQYRGTATGSHDFNWYDPTGHYPSAPGDNHGHGTHTMGTMIGDDGTGNRIGVAPDAQWIAAKGCAGRGCAGSDLLKAAEWMLAPCSIGVEPGDDACDPAKRPQVVNNSWGGLGGDSWFEGMVSAWRAAGIFPAFAAGNSGPGDGTVGSPGDYATSFATGATDQADTVCWFSSRGPSHLTPETKPDVAAPGCKGIRSALPGGGYGTKNGTSMASPHTAGVVALLLEANPGLTVEQIEALLMSTAVDRGPQGPDKTYGYGRLDAYAAGAGAGDPIPWLSVSPTSGNIAPGQQTQVTLTLNAAGLAQGTHTARLVITSNDPDQPTFTVPVTLTVTSGAPVIAHVHVSNLRDVSAAVSWITSVSATGKVYYGADPASLTNVAHDDRGAGTVDDVHHVTLGGLNPDTTYYFYVVSDETADGNNGQHYQFTTGAPLNIRSPDNVYGQVFKSDGVTPAADVLVYLRVLDNDASGNPGQSGLLSGLTDSSGYWIDAKTGGAVNLAAVRTEDDQSYFAYSQSGDAVRIAIQGAADCEGLTQVDTGDDSPAPDITLSCLNMINLDITPGWSAFVWPAVPAEAYDASDLLGAILDAGGDVPEISQWLSELGNWSGHLRGLPFGDFEIASGEPYFLRSTRRSLLRLEAGVGVAQSEVITLTTGWNFVALPRTAGVMTAEAACEQIVALGGALDEINRWDANVGNWAGHICGLPFGDFEMTPDEGYFIKSQADSTWRPTSDERPTTKDEGQNTQYAVRNTQYYASDVRIRNVQVTNVTDRSFTVLWETDQPAPGQVRFGSSPSLGGVAYDDRGAVAVARTHHVTVGGLSPGSTYYFEVESGATVEDNGGQRYQVATGPTLGIPGVETAYGRVLELDGETPAAGVLVLLLLRDGDRAGSPGESAPLSAVTDGQGYWTVNLGAARTVAGDAYFTADGADRVVVRAWHPVLGHAARIVSLGELPAALPLELRVAWRAYLPFVVRR